MYVTKRDGTTEPRDIKKIQRAVAWMCDGLNVSQSDLETSVHLPLYDGVKTRDIQRTLIVEAASKISPQEPDWTFAAARGLLLILYKQANDGSMEYPHLRDYLSKAVAADKLAPCMNDEQHFDLDGLNSAIRPVRDLELDYLGLQTLADRYFVRVADGEEDVVIELPQFFFMRVAMGIALAEPNLRERTRCALNYYEIFSRREALPSTPTLFNSGTNWPQLSSCFGQYYGDDTDSIMDGLKETANYSKFAGGCSASMTAIRASGSRIKSTGGKAGGPIPYAKLYNDSMLAFDQSGKRKGSGALYLEPWHADIWNFLDLKEPGDDRRRTHDIFPALWIPDLFMKRVQENGVWSLFSPSVDPRLHETYGQEFEDLYLSLEAEGKYTSQVPAEDLWSRILERLFTHGTFWPNFKDTFNSRYAQPEIIHNSNLCTEIGLRNDSETSFVCNLTSINLGADKHLLVAGPDGQYEWNSALERTVRLMVRSLDSVITVGFIPHENGRRFQHEDRAIGLGCMGWADALAKMGIDYESAAHVHYANEVWRQISLSAIDESANLARELGSYPNFPKSTWADGMLPVDTLRHHRVVRMFGLQLDKGAPFATLDELRTKVAGGMRNSCLMAIAPTATIANILGVSQCTELPWELGYYKKNLSGLFRVFATTMRNNRYGLPVKTARQIDQRWTVWAAAARQIWIDQAQSTNFFLNPDLPLDQVGEMIDDLYFEAWKCGLKSTYYFYAKAESTESLDLSQPSSASAVAPAAPAVAGGDYHMGAGDTMPAMSSVASVASSWTGGKVCAIDAGPDCESCQ